jgi:hypothetical protein
MRARADLDFGLQVGAEGRVDALLYKAVAQRDVVGDDFQMIGKPPWCAVVLGRVNAE